MKQYSYGICPYIITNKGVYILMNKTSGTSKLNFFKGKIEINESIMDCAIREFKEESGILVQEKHLENYFYSTSPRKNIGIFLVDWNFYLSKEFNLEKREIYSKNWINFLGKNIISNNQTSIYNNIGLYFGNKNLSILNYSKGEICLKYL